MADPFIDLLEWLDPPQRQGLISRLAVGFYEGWRPGRGEVADLVAVELGVIGGEEHLQRSRRRNTGHPDLVEFTGRDFAEHRRRRALPPPSPPVSGRTRGGPGTATPNIGGTGVPATGQRPTRAPSRSVTVQRESVTDLTVTVALPVTDGESLLALAGLAVRETVQLIPDAQWVGVTARFAGEPFTAAHTHPVVLVVDAAQYAQGDGPCLTAMRTNREVATTVGQGRARWPQLAGAAADSGVRSFLAEPLHAHGRVVGSLNMYSARARGLRNDNPDLLTMLTDALDRGLDNYWNTHPETDRATGLQDTLHHHWVIHHAITSLTVADALTLVDATTVLHQRAEKTGVTLEQAAQQIINQHPGTAVQ